MILKEIVTLSESKQSSIPKLKTKLDKLEMYKIRDLEERDFKQIIEMRKQNAIFHLPSHYFLLFRF